MLSGNFDGILKFDLEKQSLAVIRVSVDMYGQGNYFQVMKAEGGGLGFLFMSVSDYTAQLWKKKTDCDGVASWELGRIIELDKLLSLKSEDKSPIALSILGFAEQNNVVLIWTVNGIFTIHLESLNFKKLAETTARRPHYHPFENIHTAGNTMDYIVDTKKNKLLFNNWLMKLCSRHSVLSQQFELLSYHLFLLLLHGLFNVNR
ncbi:hypothetical protein ACQJBY_030874 [Aegilops geniculata]